MIQTVRGKIEHEEIRNTLAHEHLVFGFPSVKTDPQNPFNRDVAMGNCRIRMDMVRECDVNLIVDPTPAECGRDPLFMKELSEETGIHLICAAGFFKDEGNTLSVLKSLSYTDDIERKLLDLYVRELTEGIGNTGIKAGIIKTASSLNRITALEHILLKVSALAQIRTGAALFTHCDRGTMGPQQAELFQALGVNPDKVVIGHQTSNHSLTQIRELMNEGFNVGFDQFGILSIPGIPDDDEKTGNLITLLKEGYEDHIVLSHDCIFDRMGYVSRSKPRYPDQIYKEIVPALYNEGISENTVRKITRDNLLRILDKQDENSSGFH